MDKETLQFLEQAKINAVKDLQAHQKGHEGRFASTIPCYLDSAGACHGIGEQIANQADAAIAAYNEAIKRAWAEHYGVEL